MEAIVKSLCKLNKDVKIVVTAMTIETVYESCRILDAVDADYSVTQI